MLPTALLAGARPVSAASLFARWPRAGVPSLISGEPATAGQASGGLGDRAAWDVRAAGPPVARALLYGSAARALSRSSVAITIFTAPNVV
jgi:hypothetical protein